MVLKFTAIPVSITFLCKCPRSVSARRSCLGLRQLVSARESLRTKSDNFPRRYLDIKILFRRVLFIIIYIRQSQQTEVFLLGALNDYEDA